jgi:hypothetical protein
MEVRELTISTMDAPKGMILTLVAVSSAPPSRSCRASSGAAMFVDARLRSPRANVNVVLRTMVPSGGVI